MIVTEVFQHAKDVREVPPFNTKGRKRDRRFELDVRSFASGEWKPEQIKVEWQFEKGRIMIDWNDKHFYFDLMTGEFITVAIVP